MIVIEFDRTRHNCVSVGEDRYFLLEQKGRAPLLAKQRCPHRGGPLHLGNGDPRTGTVSCPWHETTFSRRALEARGAPTVRVGDRVTGVFDAASDVTVALYRQERIIANGVR